MLLARQIHKTPLLMWEGRIFPIGNICFSKITHKTPLGEVGGKCLAVIPPSRMGYAHSECANVLTAFNKQIIRLSVGTAHAISLQCKFYTVCLSGYDMFVN